MEFKKQHYEDETLIALAEAATGLTGWQEDPYSFISRRHQRSYIIQSDKVGKKVQHFIINPDLSLIASSASVNLKYLYDKAKELDILVY